MSSAENRSMVTQYIAAGHSKKLIIGFHLVHVVYVVGVMYFIYGRHQD